VRLGAHPPNQPPYGGREQVRSCILPKYEVSYLRLRTPGLLKEDARNADCAFERNFALF
jgi:hypothetical protein